MGKFFGYFESGKVCRFEILNLDFYWLFFSISVNEQESVSDINFSGLSVGTMYDVTILEVFMVLFSFPLYPL